ncbi:MAG: DNA primase [Defluviitaleaceae bacterium]|nr:DNA primase [Defluviitaleaceae bacterium]
MVYSQDVIEDLRQGNDIVEVISGYIALRQSGANHMGLCPFHRERSPSFSVSAHRQLFHCFGCGEGGNVFTFIMKMENFSFVDAIKFLAERINYRLPQTASAPSVSSEEKERMHQAYAFAARFYYENLQAPPGQPAMSYLEHRRLIPAIQRKFGLGWAGSGSDLRDHLSSKGFADGFLVKAGLAMEGSRGHYDRFRGRLMFPIFDVQGKIVGFGGRIIGDGEPKYLNSPETPIFDKSRTLYNLNYARQTKKQTLILVEGYMDVIALYQAGIKNVVAALGTAFTANHARILKRYCNDAVLLFDTDEAGTKAALRAIPHLYSAGLGIKVCRIESAKDPDDYIQEFGVQALAEQLSNSYDFVDFQVQTANKGIDMSQTSQRITFTKASAKIISALNSPVEREAYARDMAHKYRMDEGALKEEIAVILGGDGSEDYIEAPRNSPIAVYDNKQGGQAFSEAVSHILSTMASDKDFCKQITKYLTGEEFADSILSEAFSKILLAQDKGKEVAPADIVTTFEYAEDQQKISRAFVKPPEYEDTKDKYIALTHQVTLVKSAHLARLMADATQNGDVEALARLSIERKNLETHKISFLAV